MIQTATYASMLQQQTISAQIQGRMSTLQTEASTGLLADPVKSMGAGVATFYALQSTQAQQSSVQTAATAVGNRLTVMQTALTSLNSLTSDISTTALKADITAGNNGAEVVSAEAGGALDQMLGLLNTTYNGQHVFSGNNSGAPSVVSSSSLPGGLMDQVNAIVSSAVSAKGGVPLSASDMAGLESSLDSVVGPSGTAFTGTDNGQPVRVSTGGTQSLSYDMKANSQPFQDIMKGMVMLSLINSGSLDGSAKKQALTDSTQLLNGGLTELTNNTALLGAKQSQLQTISDNQKAAAAATQLQIATMDAADPYKTATELTNLKTQLQVTYEITSMIGQLSFVDYMR